MPSRGATELMLTVFTPRQRLESVKYCRTMLVCNNQHQTSATTISHNFSAKDWIFGINKMPHNGMEHSIGRYLWNNRSGKSAMRFTKH